MRYSKSVLYLPIALAFLLLALVINCASNRAGDITGGAGGDESLSATGEPTMAECRQWITSSATLSVPIACPDWMPFRLGLLQRGGGAFTVGPAGNERYYLVWFPDDWENVADRKIVISLHGTGGCAEWMLNHWYTTSLTHSWGLVALQYYDPRTRLHDDDEAIYQNLEAVVGDLRAHCPITGSDIFYHGFSMGSANSFPVAVRDRAAADHLFAAFIADSGCAGLNHPTLKNAPDDALTGARFWMWCGENDISTISPTRMTCAVMRDDMIPYVEGHGGQVDALVEEEGTSHGMFEGCEEDPDYHPDTECHPRTADNLGPSLPILFEYIERFPKTHIIYLPLLLRDLEAGVRRL